MLEPVREKITTEIPVARFGEAEEIGRTVAFLAGAESGCIMAIDIPVDGGYYMR